jgi:hypothetical protein
MKKKWVLETGYDNLEFDSLWKAIHRAKHMDNRFIAKRGSTGIYADDTTGLRIRKRIR